VRSSSSVQGSNSPEPSSAIGPVVSVIAATDYRARPRGKPARTAFPTLPPGAKMPTGTTTKEDPMDAIQLLKADHDEMKKLLTELESTTERGVKTRQELFAKVREELTVHEAIEEEIFYPALKVHPKTKEITLEAYEEHHVVDMVMAEIEGVPFDDETWGAKFKVMKENIEHHIEEEEREMFKLARDAFEKQDLEELGERMTARKHELLAA
jgi:hypothetical protein